MAIQEAENQTFERVANCLFVCFVSFDDVSFHIL